MKALQQTSRFTSEEIAKSYLKSFESDPDYIGGTLKRSGKKWRVQIFLTAENVTSEDKFCYNTKVVDLSPGKLRDINPIENARYYYKIWGIDEK